MAIDASPLFSLLAGNVVQSYLSSTPQVQVSCPVSVKTILKVMVKLLVGVLHCINLLQMMLTMCVIIHVLFL